MYHTNCSFQNCFELLLLWLLRQDRIKIRTVLVASAMTKRTPEEAEIPLPQQVVFVAPGGWETRIKAYTDETIDDIKGRVRKYIETEHGLKLWKRNFWMSQEGKHIP